MPRACRARPQLLGRARTWWMLRGARPPGIDPRAARGPSLPARLREPAFLGLALSFSAHAFIATGLVAHLIPLLRERGW